MKKEKRHAEKVTQKAETIKTTEFKCGFCDLTFYTEYSKAERCPYCGSTSEIDAVRHLKLKIEEHEKC